MSSSADLSSGAEEKEERQNRRRYKRSERPYSHSQLPVPTGVRSKRVIWPHNFSIADWSLSRTATSARVVIFLLAISQFCGVGFREEYDRDVRRYSLLQYINVLYCTFN